MTDTKVTGAWPLRFSVDGKYLACRSDNSGSSERLRVVAVHEKFVKKDIGQFSYIGHIKPVADGTFLISAQVGNQWDKDGGVVGSQIWPDTAKIEQIWRHSHGNNIGEQTDFLPATMIGVSTDFKLVTHLLDLRTGNSLLSLDNSANYRPIILTYTSRDIVNGDGWIVLAVALIGLFVITVAVCVAIRHRRARAKGPASLNEAPMKMGTDESQIENPTGTPKVP